MSLLKAARSHELSDAIRPMTVSPAPSEASSVAFKPQTFHSQPITYGSGQLKKKKTKRIQDSDDEAHCQPLPITSSCRADFDIQLKLAQPHLPLLRT